MSYSTATICAKCAQQSGITQCEGCHKKFCNRCNTLHREELAQELDEIVQHRNELAESINTRLPQGSNTCSSLKEIDRWQKEMYANIDRVAEAARNNVRELLTQGNEHIRLELDQITRRLQQRQQTGGYVEGDLNQFKQQLEKLRDAVKRFNEQIQVDTSVSKNIAWDSMLFVVSNRENSVAASAPVSSAPGAPPSSNSYDGRRRHSEQISTGGGRQSLPHPQSMASSSSHNRSSMPYQPYGWNTSSPAPSIRSATTRQSERRSASMNSSSRPQSYQCIGCKTTNFYKESGPNNCSVCRYPAPV